MVGSRSRATARVGVLALLGGLLLLLGGRSASARGELVLKRLRFEERAGKLTISGGFREMFDERLRRRLRSGFATTVVMRVYLFDRRGKQPLVVTGRTLRAVYDLWEERYLLRIDGPQGRRVRRLRREKDVVDRLTSFWRFPLVGIERIDPDRFYFVAAIVEVNPMSPEVLAQVRRWLRRPALSPHRRGEESFFGSFVSIFVNDKIRRAQRTFKVRSQPFYRPR